ncbi:hypothetical protein B0T13DRAFT_510562 [Neurospora crassa]|nr:hypothetical protein B0T13DRAFT_510562 [Neurospora crassa]
MCGTKISYACSTTLISQSTTCSCAKVIACGKSTLYCGTCSHPRCKELRSESSVTNKLEHRRDKKKKRAERARASTKASKHGGGRGEAELEANLTQERNTVAQPGRIV